MNQAFLGTSEAPGTISETITNALELGREIGQFDHDVAPSDLIAFEIVNQ
jgi:hypothetical protein